MPKRTDPALKERALRMYAEHRGGLSVEDGGDRRGRGQPADRPGVGSSVGQAGRDRFRGAFRGDVPVRPLRSARLKAENKRLREANDMLRQASIFFAGNSTPPQAVIMAFIDDMRARGHAVESICAVLTGSRLPDRRADLPLVEAARPARGAAGRCATR